MEYLSYQKDFTFLTFDNKGSYDPTKKIFRKLVRKWEPKEMKSLDIVGWFHPTGQVIWLEVKRPKPDKTYLDKEQKAFMLHVLRTNGYAEVVRSIDDARVVVERFRKDR